LLGLVAEYPVFVVSVIVPVYNAAQYLREAVESAISIDCVGEVLLIEDCSIDNSLEVCLQLEGEYERVRLVHHAEKVNLGAGKARNLGIKAAAFDYISFLDADDYYLPNRFEKEVLIFSKHTEIEGVYGCTGAVFANDIVRRHFLDRYKTEETTVTDVIDDGKLLYYLLFGGKGRFHTNAITLRKSVFYKAGFFDQELKLAQDSDMWARLAATCHLVAGNTETPVAIRRVHETNRIHSADAVIEKYRRIMYLKLFGWSVGRSDLAFGQKNYFFLAYRMFVEKEVKYSLIVLLMLTRHYPKILLGSFFYRKLFQIMTGGKFAMMQTDIRHKL
jgi:glycosyltransferase involved in cell wall biosynthesis